jgi:hypothetical protein
LWAIPLIQGIQPAQFPKTEIRRRGQSAHEEI